MDRPVHYAREAADAMLAFAEILRAGGGGGHSELERIGHLLHRDMYDEAIEAFERLSPYGMGGLYDNYYGDLGEPLRVNSAVICAVTTLLIGMARDRMEKLKASLSAGTTS